MGLAASQARFLGITMRKAQCEFKSTELAQQKLEITDQLSGIAQDYSKAMNATKLIWSNETSDRNYGVTYSLLMMPSSTNDYNPCLVTSRSGAIILNSEYAEAAEKAGISMGGGIGSEAGRNAFINALKNRGLVTESTAASITGTTTDTSEIIHWNSMAGLGATPMAKNYVSAMTISDLISDRLTGLQTIGLKSFDFNTSKSEITDNGYTLITNGSIDTSSSDINTMTLGDLLSNDIVIMAKQSSKDKYTFSSYVDNILQSVAAILGNGQIGKGINMDDASNEALMYALTMTKHNFLSTLNIQTKNSTIGSSQTDKSNLNKNTAYQNAISYNRIGGDSSGTYIACSLSNMVNAFLTYYANSLGGTGASSYYVGAGVTNNDNNFYVTSDKGYYYITQNNTLESNVKIADFYDELYNNICAHGWRMDDGVDKSEYLESTIKDGRYSLSTLNADGYYYQVRYNDVEYLEEVADEDAIARAEAEYTRKKAELTYKEDSIDIQSKNIDAEISELANEMESVKKLIQTGIEKTFNTFSQ